MASQNLGELTSAYDNLDCGLIIVDKQLKIHYLNRWVQMRRTSIKADPVYLKDLFDGHNVSFVEKLILTTLKNKGQRIISPAFHSWLIPLYDPNFDDKLMRQRGTVSFLTFIKDEVEVAGVLIQLQDKSNLAIQNKRLNSLLNKSQDQQKQLADLNESLEERVEKRTIALQNSNERLQYEIQERKNAEKNTLMSELKFRSMIESLSDPASICSADLEITYMNPALIKKIGRDATGEKCYRALYHLESRCDWCMWETIKQGKSSVDETVSPLNGRTYQIFSSPVFFQDEIMAKMTICRDITAEKELHDSILHAKNEAETACSMKDRFISMISHEIRNPLHAILSFSDFGVRKTGTVSVEKVITYFHHISVAAQRILVLVNDLLDLSKMESGKMDYTIIKNNVLEIIEEAIIEQDAVAKKKGITIHLSKEAEIETKVFCDRQKIMQVITNLLSNAIKFSPDEESIAVCVNEGLNKGKRESDHFGSYSLIVKVKDSGPGVAPEELESIFRSYVQSSKTRNVASGTGLGLAISQSIIHAHSGRIWAENNTGVGSSFCFTLPFERSEKQAEANNAHPIHRSTK